MNTIRIYSKNGKLYTDKPYSGSISVNGLGVDIENPKLIIEPDSRNGFVAGYYVVTESMIKAYQKECEIMP